MLHGFLSSHTDFITQNVGWTRILFFHYSLDFRAKVPQFFEILTLFYGNLLGINFFYKILNFRVWKSSGKLVKKEKLKGQMSYVILFIIKFLDNVSRISYSHRVIRNVVDDNAASTDDASFANVNTRADDDPCSQPVILTNGCRTAFHDRLSALQVVDWMLGSNQLAHLLDWKRFGVYSSCFCILMLWVYVGVNFLHENSHHVRWKFFHLSLWCTKEEGDEGDGDNREKRSDESCFGDERWVATEFETEHCAKRGNRHCYDNRINIIN